MDLEQAQDALVGLGKTSAATFIALALGMTLFFPTKEEVPTKQDIAVIERKVETLDKKQDAMSLTSCIVSAKDDAGKDACVSQAVRNMEEESK